MESLYECIDQFINSHKWNPELTDDENIENIISEYGNSTMDRILLRYYIINDLEQKINDGVYYSLLITDDNDNYSTDEDIEY